MPILGRRFNQLKTVCFDSAQLTGTRGEPSARTLNFRPELDSAELIVKAKLKG